MVDHFEWAWSYVKRLGLFSVDYTTQTRVWNDSGHLCVEVARSNTVAAPHPAVLNAPNVRVRQPTKNWHLRRPREEE